MNNLKAFFLLSHCMMFISLMLSVCISVGYDPLGVGIFADNHPFTTVAVLVLIFSCGCLSAVFNGKRKANTADIGLKSKK